MPEWYIKWPMCEVPGCGGKLYVDTYRLNKGKHDHAPLCHEDCIPKPSSDGSRFRHPVSDKGCRHYEEYQRSKDDTPRSRHNPKGSLETELRDAHDEYVAVTDDKEFEEY